MHFYCILNKNLHNFESSEVRRFYKASNPELLMKKKFYCLFTFQLMVAFALNWAVIQPTKADSFIPTGSMNVARDQFAAVLLTNGLVQVVGKKTYGKSRLTYL
jgi:hypothetical protein